jgi:hypothetical protein
MDFIDKHRGTHGIEPICKVLQVAPSGYRRHAALRRDPQRRCARVRRDEALAPQITRVWQTNMQVYGADKVWRQLTREGTIVARCTVERLMRRQGLRGACERTSFSMRSSKLCTHANPSATAAWSITRIAGRNTCPFGTASAWQRPNRAVSGQQGRQLRQRLGRDHQWALQGRVDSSPRALEDQGGSRVCDVGMGSLVQQPSVTRAHRIHSSR